MLRTAAIALGIALSAQAGLAVADSAFDGAATICVGGQYCGSYDQRRAEALADDVQAQKFLAMLYDTGDGVPRSVFWAYVWYRVADLHVDVDLTRNLDYLSPCLTRTEAEFADRTAISLFTEIGARKRTDTILARVERQDAARVPVQRPLEQVGPYEMVLGVEQGQLGPRIVLTPAYTWTVCDDCSFNENRSPKGYKHFEVAIGSKLTF